MALKLIQRRLLLGQLGIQRYPPVGPLCPTRLLRTSPAGRPSCVACLCTPASCCIRKQGCQNLQLDPVVRSLATITREPYFICSSSVEFHSDLFPRFSLIQQHQPTTAEEKAFQQRLGSCSSSWQVFKLLRTVGIMSDTMAAAALHRVADLEQDGNSLKDPSMLENHTIRALCFQVEQDSGRLTDGGLVSALLACTRLFLDPWSTLMVRLVSESQERLDRGHMSVGQLCTLGQAMLAMEGHSSVMLQEVMEQIQKQEPSQWSLADLIAVYRLMQSGVGEVGKYRNLMNAMHTHAVSITFNMDPAAVSQLLSALVTLNQTQARPLVISLCKQATRHMPHFTDKEFSLVLEALMYFGHSDNHFVEAMEKYVPRMAFTSQPETVTKVMQFFGQRNILSPPVFDIIAESFVYRADDYSTSQVATQIIPFGKLGYLPPNAGEMFRKVETILRARFSHFQPRTLLNLLHSCILVERFPVNFVSKVFSSYFLQHLQEDGKKMDPTVLAQLTQLYMTLKLECPFFELMALSKSVVLPGDRPVVPQELRRRRRGSRSGTKRRDKRKRHKPAVPAIIMGNVRSLGNKMDELAALVKTQREYRECSIFCFTETWLHSHIHANSVGLPGYSLVRGDRDCSSSRKKKGGGIALFVSERWCNPGHVNLKERLCSPDIELLAVGMRPYYLPREFTSTIVIVVYIPPSADAAVACDVISSAAAKLQTEHPDAFMVITGDFNHVSFNTNFHQYVDCPTRDNKTLDLLYANAMDAYDVTALPPLGRSDHNLVMMSPRYVPLVRKQPVLTRTVRRWTQESADALQDCFESTDWDVLCEPHGEDIDKLTVCITDYIKFCEDTTIPARTVRCFPNNKPWITSDLKALLNKKKRAFRSGDKEEQRRVQHELRQRLRTCKDNYRKKLEAKLQQNSVRDVWTGMKHITGMTGRDRLTAGSLDRANQFNQFFNRFSSPPVTPQTSPPLHTPTLFQMAQPSRPSPVQHLSTCSSSSSSSSPTSSTKDICSNPCPTVTTGQVKRQLERLHQRKAAGPDGITPRILKTCANQLSPVLGHLYNMSLSQQKVPLLWKTSCLVPVPKKSRPSDLADYRPVALTSHVMKVLERLVLAQLRPRVRMFLDPLQFAYQPHLGVDDAVIYLLQRTHMHLDGGEGTVRITFFDFSSAFNTIQPLLLGEKLQVMGVDDTVISWITDYLTGRPQFVRLGSVLSDVVVSDTGAPQGTVLSPFLFTLYTTDFQYNSESCHLQKFSDDSAVVGCIREGEEGEYRTLVDNFVEWSEQNHLRLNVNKTREMVIDFRRKRMPSQPVLIRGEVVEEVKDYKYLGVVIDNRLDWKSNTEAVYKKGMSRLYFLRKLRSFNVCSKMLEIFYQSVVASVIFFAAVCWGSSIRASDTNRLDKIIKKAGSVLGVRLETFGTVVERRMLNKLFTIMDNDQHPLHHTVDRQRSTFSHRLLQLRCRKERYRKSFLPQAISVYNNS